MTDITPLHRPPEEAPSPTLHDRAMDNLHYIRRTMESSGRFTALSGLGALLIGVTGLVGSVVAAGRPTEVQWLITWLVAAAIGLPVAGWAVERKARLTEARLLDGPGRKFVLGFAPALGAGAVLTWALYGAGLFGLMPGMWLLLYGVGVVTAGMFSVRIVPLMGLSFMTMGVLALLTPSAWGDIWMAAGFGGLHLVYGAVITRRYGG